jgi:hypothetical protein
VWIYYQVNLREIPVRRVILSHLLFYIVKVSGATDIVERFSTAFLITLLARNYRFPVFQGHKCEITSCSQ